METLGEPVNPEQVILCLALLFVMYLCCTVLFAKDASKLRHIKSEQATRIWRQPSFHKSIKLLRDGTRMTDELARERSLVIEASRRVKKRTGSRISRSMRSFATNHRVFALFVQDVSYSRGPTLLLELVSYLFSVAVLQV